MDKLNENAGLIILIAAIVLVMLTVVVIALLISLRKKLAVQRLKFIGQFAVDPDTRKMVADITVSNRSLNDITIAELGLKNGRVNFNYTELLKAQNKLNKDARIVVGQRDAVRLVLSAENLVKVLIQNDKGKAVLKKVYVYAMDSTGVAYQGKVSDVRKLLAQLSKSGVDYLPPALAVKSTPQPVGGKPMARSEARPMARPEARPMAKPNARPVPQRPAPAPASQRPAPAPAPAEREEYSETVVMPSYEEPVQNAASEEEDFVSYGYDNSVEWPTQNDEYGQVNEVSEMDDFEKLE